MAVRWWHIVSPWCHSSQQYNWLPGNSMCAWGIVGIGSVSVTLFPFYLRLFEWGPWFGSTLTYSLLLISILAAACTCIWCSLACTSNCRHGYGAKRKFGPKSCSSIFCIKFEMYGWAWLSSFGLFLCFYTFELWRIFWILLCIVIIIFFLVGMAQE